MDYATKIQLVNSMKTRDELCRKLRHLIEMVLVSLGVKISEIHAVRGKELGDYISVDIAVFVNCPSCAKYKYVAFFVDHATIYS